MKGGQFMGKVITGNFRQFLAEYLSQGRSVLSDNVSFTVGVLLTVMVPVASYCSHGGPVPPVLFVGALLAGLYIGTVKYRLAPTEAIVQLRLGNAPKAPARVNPRKAA